MNFEAWFLSFCKEDASDHNLEWHSKGCEYFCERFHFSISDKFTYESIFSKQYAFTLSLRAIVWKKQHFFFFGVLLLILLICVIAKSCDFE